MNASELSQEHKKKNIIKSMHTFLKNHKRLTIAIVATLAVIIVCVTVVTLLHTVQAKKITQAQIGRCYIASTGSTTEVHYFQENGCSRLYIGYKDESRQRVTYVSGSLSEINDQYSFEISLFGTVHLDYLSYDLPVVFGENYQIVSHRMGEWKLIPLEEALEMEEQIKRQYESMQVLDEACVRTCNSAIGAEGFLERLNGHFKSAAFIPSIASNDSYISAAQSLLSEFLKNPSSAVYYTKRVVEIDSYGRAIVYLDLSAQNSFGGFVRSSYYICLQQVFGSRYTYNSILFSVNSPDQLEYLKSANSWNEDPSEDKDTTPFEPGQPENEGAVEVNGLTLHRYVFKSEKATYIAYIEPTSQYVIAAEISVNKDTLGTYGLASAVAGAVTATHDYAVPQYDKVFNCDSGIVSTAPFFNDKCGCMYHAAEKNGKYYISVTNIEALGCTKTNYWSPIKINKTQAQTTSEQSDTLEQLLDGTKHWVAPWEFDGWAYNVHFVFKEDGTCYFALGEMEVLDAGMGTYTVKDGKTLSISLKLSGKKYSATYDFDPEEFSLTVTSKKGIVGEKGEVFCFTEDKELDAELVEDWGRDWTDGIPEDDEDPWG